MALTHLAALAIALAAPPPLPAAPAVEPEATADAAEDEDEDEEDEIVITAVKGKCRVQLADRLLSDREFDERTDLWASGRAVRVVEPRGANYKCLAKIMFRLNDKGVRLIRFVDYPDDP